MRGGALPHLLSKLSSRLLAGLQPPARWGARGGAQRSGCHLAGGRDGELAFRHASAAGCLALYAMAGTLPWSFSRIMSSAGQGGRGRWQG